MTLTRILAGVLSGLVRVERHDSGIAIRTCLGCVAAYDASPRVVTTGNAVVGVISTGRNPFYEPTSACPYVMAVVGSIGFAAWREHAPEPVPVASEKSVDWRTIN